MTCEGFDVQSLAISLQKIDVLRDATQKMETQLGELSRKNLEIVGKLVEMHERFKMLAEQQAGLRNELEQSKEQLVSEADFVSLVTRVNNLEFGTEKKASQARTALEILVRSLQGIIKNLKGKE